MIVFADLHAREETEDVVFNQVLPGLYEALANDTDKTLACLGDFFHLRYRIPVHLQNKVVEFLDAMESAGYRLILLPGNHDQINVLGEHALEVFRRYPNVDVLTEPQWNEYGYWIPYRKKSEDIARALEQGAQTREGKPPVLWMHHGIQGAYVSPQIRDKTSLPAVHFKQWIVLCGHYHIRQQLGTVRYIGSPYQVTAAEAGQTKGYAIWDAHSLELNWVDMEWGKRYHNILYSGGAFDLSKVKPGDELRVVTSTGVDPVEVGKQLAASGAQYVVTPEVEIAKSRLKAVEDGGGGSLYDYAVEYVNQFAGELEKDRLMDIYKGLCE